MPHYSTYDVGNYPHIEWVYAYILLHDGITLEGLQRMKDKLLAFKDAETASMEEAMNAQTKQALSRIVNGPSDDLHKLDRIVVDDLRKLERAKRERLVGKLNEVVGKPMMLHNYEIEELERYVARAKQARGSVTQQTHDLPEC